MSVRSRPPGAINERASVQQLFDRLCKYDPSKPLVHVSRAQRYPTMPTAVPLLTGKVKDVAGDDTGDIKLLDALRNLVGGGSDCFDGTVYGDRPWVEGNGNGATDWMASFKKELVFLEDRLADAFKTQIWVINLPSRVEFEEDSVRAFQLYGAAVEAEQKSTFSGWSEFKDEDGNPYFYNEKKKESAWEKPIVDEALLEANDNFENAYKAFTGLHDRMIQTKARLEVLQKRNFDLDEKLDFFVTLFKYVAFCAAFRSTRMSLLEMAERIIEEYSAEPVRMGGDHYGYYDFGLTRASMEECIRTGITKETLAGKIEEIQKRRDEWNAKLESEKSRLSKASNAHKAADTALKTAASSLSDSQKSHNKTRGNVDKVERDREQLLQRQKQDLFRLDESLLKAKADNEAARQALYGDMAKHKEAVRGEQNARSELQNAKKAVEAMAKHTRDFK